jgi:hypothetical protein
MNPQRSAADAWPGFLPWIAAGCFLACAGGTVIQMLVEWSALPRTAVFYFGKNAIVLWLTAAALIGRPTIGSLIAATWGVVVPLEKYGLLIREALSGLIGVNGLLAPMDELRLLLLFIGTYLSFILAFEFHTKQKKPRTSATAKHPRSPMRVVSKATEIVAANQDAASDLSGGIRIEKAIASS